MGRHRPLPAAPRTPRAPARAFTGQLLADSGGMVNQGTILADRSRRLIVDPSAPGFPNLGTMIAAGTGGIDIQDGAGTAFTTSGQVLVNAGSRFDVLGAAGVYEQTGGITTVNGLLTATTRVDVLGGFLGGTGTIVADVTNATGGTVGAGNSPGTLSITGNYAQDAASTLQVEIDGLLQGIQFDLLDITGSASLSGAADVVLDALFTAGTLSVGDTFQILGAGGGILGGVGFDVINVNLAGVAFQQIVGANDVVLEVIRDDFVLGQVPEPGTWGLLGIGLLAAGAARRRAREPRRAAAG